MDEAATSARGSSGSDDEVGEVPVVAWNELTFVRRTESDAFIMTADRFGAGLGVVAHVPALASWRGASGDGSVIAWFDTSNATTLLALREGDASPQSIPYVTTTRGWSPVGAQMLLLLAEPGVASRTVLHDFGTDAQLEVPIPAVTATIEWSAGGGRIAYRADDALWVADIAAGTTREVRPLDPSGGYDWLPDGTQLVVGEHGVIVVVDVDSGEQSVIGEWGELGPAHLAVSPDGAWIAWLVATGGQGGLLGFDGSGPARIVEFVAGTPAWNYSSEGFTFTNHGHAPDCFDSGCTGIVLVDAVARESRTQSGARSAWAPDADWLAIDLEIDGLQRVRALDAATDERYDVSALADDDPTRDYGLAWR